MNVKDRIKLTAVATALFVVYQLIAVLGFTPFFAILVLSLGIYTIVGLFEEMR